MERLVAHLERWVRDNPGKVALFRESSAQHFPGSGSYTWQARGRGRRPLARLCCRAGRRGLPLAHSRPVIPPRPRPPSCPRTPPPSLAQGAHPESVDLCHCAKMEGDVARNNKVFKWNSFMRKLLHNHPRVGLAGFYDLTALMPNMHEEIVCALEAKHRTCCDCTHVRSRAAARSSPPCRGACLSLPGLRPRGSVVGFLTALPSPLRPRFSAVRRAASTATHHRRAQDRPGQRVSSALRNHLCCFGATRHRRSPATFPARILLSFGRYFTIKCTTSCAASRRTTTTTARSSRARPPTRRRTRRRRPRPRRGPEEVLAGSAGEASFGGRRETTLGSCRRAGRRGEPAPRGGGGGGGGREHCSAPARSHRTPSLSARGGVVVVRAPSLKSGRKPE